MHKIYRKTIHHQTWKEIKKPRAGCWQFYVTPSDDELQEIARLSGIALESIRESFDDPFEYPRIEKENASILLVLRVPVKTDMGVGTEPMLFIMTEEHIISVMHSERGFTERLIADPLLTSTQKNNFLLRVLLHAIHSYEYYLRAVNKQILGKKISLKKLHDEDIVTLVELGETLTNFHSALVPLSIVFENIASGKILTLFEKDKDVLDDLITGGKQVLEWAKVNLKSAISVREAHEAILANRLNQTIKVLSSITILVTIPNIIAGLFGMNVILPLQGNPLAFMFVIGVTSIFMMTAFFFFRKNKWL